MSPNGQAATQDEQPLQMSGWMKTFSNSLWMIAPVGHACWQGAATQCLQTSLIISQRPALGSLSNRSREKPALDTLGSSTTENCSTNLHPDHGIQPSPAAAETGPE